MSALGDSAARPRASGRRPWRSWRLALGLLPLLAATPSQAQLENITAGELALTHPVCYDVQGIPLTGWVQHFRHSPRAPYWESLMGKTFWSMHHFCWALIHLQRGNRAGATAQERAYRHRTAANDFYFVINYAKQHGEDNFILMPEMYYRAGDAYAQIEDYAAAIAEFDKALEVKHDYWPPYDGKAQILDKLGKRKEAREMLERGLRAIPGEPTLTASLIKMGGKPPPVAAKPAAAPAEATAAAPASAPH